MAANTRSLRARPAAAQPRFSFQSKLERLAPGVNYFGLSVPLKISRALGTRGPVPVLARVNDSVDFQNSLYPVGGGRHYLRVKAEIRNAVKLKEGARVRVQITVLERSAKVPIPGDLASALSAEGVLESFNVFPIGKRNHLIGWIEKAARPQTREKRIQAVVDIVHQKRERQG